MKMLNLAHVPALNGLSLVILLCVQSILILDIIESLEKMAA